MGFSDVQLNSSEIILFDDKYWQKYLTLSVLFTGITISILGNAAVVFIYIRKRKLRKQRCFVIALSIMGIVCSVSYIPSSFRAATGFVRNLTLDCLVDGLLSGCFAVSSIILLAVIAGERCLIIVYKPFLAHRITLKHRCTAVLLTLLYSFVLTVPPLLGWSQFAPIGYRWSCIFSFETHDASTRSYIIFLLLFAFFVPCFVILFSYIKIAQVVFAMTRRHGKAGQSHTVDGEYNVVIRNCDIKYGGAINEKLFTKSMEKPLVLYKYEACGGFCSQQSLFAGHSVCV